MEFVVLLFLWAILINIVMNTNRKISRERRLKILSSLNLLTENYNVKFAENILLIKKWKDKLPQMSSWSKNVYDKSSLNTSDLSVLLKFQEELEKGIFAHGLPIYLSLIPVLYAFDNLVFQVLNLIGILAQISYYNIQKYNYHRFTRLITAKQRRMAK